MSFDIPREDSVVFLKHRDLQIEFNVIREGDNERFFDADVIRLVNLGLFASFGRNKYSSRSGREC